MGDELSGTRPMSKILSGLLSIQMLTTVAYLDITGFANTTLVHMLATEITILIALLLPITVAHTGMINEIIVTLREFYDEYMATVREWRTASKTLDKIIEKSLDSMEDEKD